jgi:large subunit ribosomal protein L28
MAASLTRRTIMASKRKITAKKPMFGNNRSHSMKSTRRQFKPNIQSKRFWVAELGRFVRVKVSAQEIKTIDKIGLPAFLKRQGISMKSLL